MEALSVREYRNIPCHDLFHRQDISIPLLIEISNAKNIAETSSFSTKIMPLAK